MYDNLPDEEVVRRDGKLYFVQVRAYVPDAAVNSIGGSTASLRNCFATGCTTCSAASMVSAALSTAFLSGRNFGRRFAWKNAWSAGEICRSSLSRRTRRRKARRHPARCPHRFPFHLSSGRTRKLYPHAASAASQRIHASLRYFRHGYGSIPHRLFGPGKLDGSLLNWVNGALLKEVAQREGYNVNFRPFKYRANTHTSILYTTRRE